MSNVNLPYSHYNHEFTANLDHSYGMRLMGHLFWFSWRMLGFAPKGSYMMKVSHLPMLLHAWHLTILNS